MKILLSHPYFDPDTPPYGLMLAQIGTALSGAGHRVTIHCGRRSYRGKQLNAPARETKAGIEIRRIWLPRARLLSAPIYALGLFWTTLIQRPDVVMVASAPPVFSAFMAALAARLSGAKLIYHLQDIHPEVSAAMGEKLGQGWCGRLLRFVDSFALKRAARIVVLSKDMKETLLTRRSKTGPITILNNFSLEVQPQQPASKWIKPAGVRRVIFAGNFGRFQRLLTLSKGLRLACSLHPDLQVMWLGEGVQKQALEQFWADQPQALFAPQLSQAQAHWLFLEADAGIVSLQHGICKTSYPSKLLSYAACNLPVLALVDPKCAVASDIEAQDLGFVSPDSSPEKIASTLINLLNAPRTEPKIDIQSGQEHTLNKWCALFEGLT